ncbi:MAG: membrane protein insertion efficiency factor YidD [Acidimicrobiia bacterium]|nr:membrane protein insertion efficiency factor YidD [Acidimicrobiia bacterium]
MWLWYLAAKYYLRPTLASKPSSDRCSTVVPRDPRMLSRTALALIRLYKLTLSPWFSGSCRFVPGCADYMSEAIARHGVRRGGWLGTKRLCRCHPFGGHGHDPVPVLSSPDR